LKQVLRLLSHGIRRKARRRGVGYAFVFMRADGAQLREIASLVQAGFIATRGGQGLSIRRDRGGAGLCGQWPAKSKVVIKVRWRKAL
jgi:hypothetical protein